MTSELYTLWQPDESRAELELECGSGRFNIKVFSCSDTLNITLTKDGTLKIGLNDTRDILWRAIDNNDLETVLQLLSEEK